MRTFLIAISFLFINIAFAQQAGEAHHVSELKIRAKSPVSGDWMGLGFDSVWLASSGVLFRSSIVDNQVSAQIPVGPAPYRGIIIGGGFVWVPSCGNKTLYKVSAETNAVVGSLQLNFAGSEGSTAFGAGSVWIVTSKETSESQDKILTRVDAGTLKVTAAIPLPFSGNGVTFQAGKVWVTSSESDQLVVVDAATNIVEKSLPTGRAPRFVTSGEGFVWILNQGDGSIQKFNAENGQPVATIDAGLAGGGGDIVYGEGAIWATMPHKPVIKIDKDANKVLLRFEGSGLGDAIRAGYGTIWVSGAFIHRIDKP